MSERGIRAASRIQVIASRSAPGFAALRLPALCVITISISAVLAGDQGIPQLAGFDTQFQSQTQALANESIPAQDLFSKRIEQSVLQEMSDSAEGSAYVIVILQPSAARAATEVQQLATIKAKQDAVLNRFAGNEFTLRYQFKTFPGFTGVINTPGLEKLAADPDVTSVGSDARVQANLTDSVPFINADQVHSLGITGQGMTVAVLDTGIDMLHIDLADNVAAGDWHFLDQGLTTGPGGQDDHGHGTNVAGIITSQGVKAPLGVAPDTDILSVKVLKSDGSGWVSDWVAGIDYVVSIRAGFNKLCAINMSLSTFTTFSSCPCDNANSSNQATEAALSAAKAAGIVTFAASGNHGMCGQMGSPACCSSATAVAAVLDPGDSGTPDTVTAFSNQSACNELAAPGNFITSAGLFGGTSTIQGTSQATPHAAGVAALMGAQCKGVGLLTPDQIVSIMKSTGAVTTDSCGVSPQPIRVNALAAVLAVVDVCTGEEQVKFSQPPACVCRGDVDADGSITVFDRNAVDNCSVGDCSLCIPNSCDITCDGFVDVDDQTAIECLFEGGTPDVCCPPIEGEDIESNIDWLNIGPNVVIADDFTSDGRPITGVRWWGSVLKEPCDKPAIAGDDCWSTACDGTTVVEFGGPSVPAIPAGFFGPGSDPVTGVVTLGGQTGLIDTVVRRLEDMCLSGPVPVQDHTSIQITQLNLQSCSPITVTFDGGLNPTFYDVEVFLDGVQDIGDLWATKTNDNGGTFDSTIPIKAGFNFIGPQNAPSYLPGTTVVLNGIGHPWVQTQPAAAICGQGGGFFPGYDKTENSCCPNSCHQGPASGHDHCVRPPKCPDCSEGEDKSCGNPGGCQICDTTTDPDCFCASRRDGEGTCVDLSIAQSAACDAFLPPDDDQFCEDNFGAEFKCFVDSCLGSLCAPDCTGLMPARQEAQSENELNWDGWFISFHLPLEEIELADAYRLDDGTMESGIGLTAGGDVIWLNQFNVEPGFEIISSISIAWGAVANGTPTTVLLYDDPNNDGDPIDAVLLTSAPTASANENTGTFTVVDIPDTFVGDAGESFFVGAVITNAAGEFPSAMDQTAPQGRSWIGAASAGEIDIHDLANNQPVLTEVIGPNPPDLAGNWLLRGGFVLVPTVQREPLALYYCDADLVDITPTNLPGCDGHPVDEYRVDLEPCCLVHANIDPRSGTVPGAKDAFFEDKCSDYLIDIEAVVGHEFIQDPTTLECMEVPTGKTLSGPFWGWHTAPNDSAQEAAVSTSVKMDDGVCLGGPTPGLSCTSAGECGIGGICEGLDRWLYGPWTPIAPACSQPNMAFELLSLIPSAAPDCNHNSIPDDCEPDCNENGVPDDCDITNGTSFDDDDNEIPDECECCVSTTPLDVKIPDTVNGNPLTTLTSARTLIFRTSQDDCPSAKAIRITLTDLKDPYHVWNGQQLWVTEPKLVSENGASVKPIPAFSNSVWASLECTTDPHCRTDWSSLGDIHVFHEGILPDSVYDIQIVDCPQACRAEESSYSPPLALPTARFGDVVRDCSKIPCSPPEGEVFILDINQILARFASDPNSPQKARAEMEPNCLDLKINIGDALQGVNAFNGLPYPFVPKASDACDSPCDNPLDLLPGIP